MSDLTQRAQSFRSAIAAFIEAERKEKQKGAADDSEKYEYEAWLSNKAKRAREVQLTTFPLKAIVPEAKIDKTTSLFLQGRELPQHKEVGSHLVAHDVLDATGNAAVLPVFKFLSETIVEGKPLVYWLLEDDPDLLAALAKDTERARQIADGFKRVDRTKQEAASHSRAKQVYWLVGDDPTDDAGYHLLQPMFSSSLVHAVHGEIQDARFGEANKEAREAFRAGKPHDGSYRDYRNLVARRLGGTKPQNISQLNSERGGVNYLLASLPPAWQQRGNLELRRRCSAFDVFYHYAGVRDQVRALARLLIDHAKAASTMEIRQARERIEQDLGASLAAFGLEQQQRYAPGWTRASDCELPLCERLWLDPGRAEQPPQPGCEEDDESFRSAYVQGDWADQVAERFANWLNDKLRAAGLTAVGDVEARHWARQALIDVAWPVALQRRIGGAA